MLSASNEEEQFNIEEETSTFVDDEYFTKETWLGEPIEQIEEKSIDDKDPYFNKLGGNPAWITKSELDIMYLSEDDPKDIQQLVPNIPKLQCSLCQQPLFLVAQCYVPLGSYDRFLYVFGCNDSNCCKKRKSWVCYRAQFKVDEKKIEEQKKKKLEQEKKQKEPAKIISEWNTSVDDKELSDLLQKQESIVQNQAKQASSSKDTKKKKKKNLKVSSGNFPCFALDIFEEPEDEEASSYELQLLQKYKATSEKEGDVYDDKEIDAFATAFMGDKIEGVKNIEEGDDSEDEEDKKEEQQQLDPRTQLKITQAFIYFQTILAKCPSQSIRWQYGGRPLWISDIPSELPDRYVKIKKRLQEEWKKKEQQRRKELNIEDEDSDDEEELEPNPSEYIPKCEKCGSPRVFELEVLPTIIYQLKANDHTRESVLEGLDFGCVCVFTCSNIECDGRKNPGDRLCYTKEYIHIQGPVD